MNAPKVSICITTKNRPELLRETLRSCYRQSYRYHEVIVNDNGAGPDLGMAGGFQAALERARGEYVIMLSDDDLLYPQAVETLVQMSQSYRGHGAYFGGTDMLQEEPNIARMTLHKVGYNSTLDQDKPLDWVSHFNPQEFLATFLEGGLHMYLFWSAGMVRRDIALRVGAFPNYGTPLMGDFIYTIGGCAAEGVSVINRALCAQRVHKLNHGRENFGKDLLAVRKAFVPELLRVLPEPCRTEGVQAKAERFVEDWIVKHSLFLRNYFLFMHMGNNLKHQVTSTLSLKSWLRFKLLCAAFEIKNLEQYARNFVV